MDTVQLHQGVEDAITWRWSATATYSAKSAYRIFFEGSTQFAAVKAIWRAWAQLKVKFFVWLAVQGRVWTADRRLRHGLQAVAVCCLCDQAPETPDHLFAHCVYTRQVWHGVLSSLRTAIQQPTTPSAMLDWWLLLRQGYSRTNQRGIDDTMFMLITWSIWKERNGRVFDNHPGISANALAHSIITEGQVWGMAGAKHLSSVGWPEVMRVGRRSSAGL
ncbi:unnamed protein product [Urochloa humidicola]